MDGQAALVTGAASGIGRAAAEQLAAKGARVLVADRNAAGGKETVARIEAAGGDAAFCEVDVGDEASVDAMVAAAVERFGRLDAAINNAGISDEPRAFTDLPTDAWDRMISINLTSVFLCMRAELRQMLEQEERAGSRGAIVNTASGAGFIPAPGMPHYTAAKHAVTGLTKHAGQEYARQRVRTNCICPGVTDTGMMAALPDEFRKMVAKTSPTGELGTPGDVAALAVWLCSPESRWVNGQNIVVDGGGVVR